MVRITGNTGTGHASYTSPSGDGFSKKQKLRLRELSGAAFELMEESGEASTRYLSRKSLGLPKPTEKKISRKELRETAERVGEVTRDRFTV